MILLSCVYFRVAYVRGHGLHLISMFEALFVVTRALFRVLYSGVSASMFGLCVKLAETMSQLVVLVVVVTVGPGCERLVRFIILVIRFSRAWRILCTFIVYLGLSTVAGMIGHIGRYCYR